jgi:hypothetical protein
MALNGSAGGFPQGAIRGHPAAILIWLKSEYNRYRINIAVDWNLQPPKCAENTFLDSARLTEGIFRRQVSQNESRRSGKAPNLIHIISPKHKFSSIDSLYLRVLGHTLELFAKSHVCNFIHVPWKVCISVLNFAFLAETNKCALP